MVTIAACVSAWFYGYFHRKSNDNLPALTAIAEMTEAEVNSILPGYNINQLREVWGEPTTSEGNTDRWEIEEITLIVNYKNNGTVAVCGLKDEVVPGDRRPMILVEDTLYLDANKVMSVEIDPSAIIGEITSSVDQSEQPTENGQSNFGYVGASYAYFEDGLAVLLNNEWCFFEKSQR